MSMAKVLSGTAVLFAIAALGVAIAALHQAWHPGESPTYAEITAEGVHRFQAAGNRMTPAQVAQLLGRPDEVYRNNPRALCWRYTAPYRIEMCWGPKRQQAWIAHNIPRDVLRS